MAGCDFGRSAPGTRRVRAAPVVALWPPAGEWYPFFMMKPTLVSEDSGAPATLGLTEGEVQVVRDTFNLVAPRAEVAARIFYRRLFELDPSLRSLFHTDLNEQGRKLMQMLAAGVRLLDKPEALLPVVEDLGRRHVNYGVRDDHYDTVSHALLWTLAEILGPRCTEDVTAVWAKFYTALAGIMKGAPIA
jgi:hemoglobin-like flavoprotein